MFDVSAKYKVLGTWVTFRIVNPKSEYKNLNMKKNYIKGKNTIKDRGT